MVPGCVGHRQDARGLERLNRSRKTAAPGGGLVYSTDGGGRMCPRCRLSAAACRCAATTPAANRGDGIARVAREVQGRKGKVVTVVRGLDLDDPALAEVARRLKAACGCGGTVIDGNIEIQGEQRDRVVAWLQQAGYTALRAGG